MSSAIGQLDSLDFPEPDGLAGVDGLRARPVRALVRLLRPAATTAPSDDETTTTESTPAATTPRAADRRPPPPRRATAPKPTTAPPPPPTAAASAAADRAAAADDRSRVTAPLSRAGTRSLARGGAVALLVAGCVACAWIAGSAARARATRAAPDGGALAPDLPRAARRRVRRLSRRARPPAPPRARAAGGARRCAVAIQLAAARRAAAPLDRRLDVLGVRPDRGRARRQSVRGHAERVPRRPGVRARRRGLARHDLRLRAGVHARLGGASRSSSGSSAAAAAWIFKVLAALAVLACALLAARLARDRPFAARARGLEPAASRSTSPAAATTTR